MTVKELRDNLNDIVNEDVLNKEINLILEESELISTILDWYIGEESPDYDPDDPTTEEYKKRNEAYNEICNMLCGRLTGIELRADLFSKNENRTLYFVSDF